MNKRRSAAGVGIAMASWLAVAGCGGGGSDESDDPTPTPANPANAAGLWRGPATVTGSAVPYGASALITANGHALIYILSLDSTVPPALSPTIIEGNLVDSGGELMLGGATYYSLLSPKTGTVSGRFDGTARGTASGTLTFASTTYNVSFTYDPQFERASSLATIAGVYTRTTGSGYTITLTINPDGSFNGTDTLSCIYTGSVAADLPTVNAYALNWTGTGCTNSNRNGTFAGRVALIDSTTVNGAKALAWFAHSPNDPLLPQLPEK